MLNLYPQFDCSDHETTLRYLITSNGLKQYRYQCVKCGALVGKIAIKMTDLDINKVSVATEWNDQISRDFYANRDRLIQAEREVEQQELNLAWWRKYNAYLNTSEWADRKYHVLDRDHYLCQAVLPGCTKQAKEVHHLTYDHVYHEPLFDLISVCKHCHDIITKLDRERRQA